MTTWIYTKRKIAGLSQGEVAEMLGVSRPTYTKLETGESVPTDEQRDMLSRIFGVSSDAMQKLEEVPATTTVDISVKSVRKEDVEKFKQVFLYVVSKVGHRPNIGQTALYKLLYFIDFDYYEKHRNFLMVRRISKIPMVLPP